MIDGIYSIGIILLTNSLLGPQLLSAAVGTYHIGFAASQRECPTNNNSVCIQGYLHLVECFRSITGNQENFSFAFFPNNKASSLYVSVTYTVENDYSELVNSSYHTEDWVWSHTVVYIMFHPTIFKYLTIGYGRMDERINKLELTIPRLCHDNNDNYKLIERLTQMVCML